jgi:FtsZ-binding cell division protein ZapB
VALEAIAQLEKLVDQLLAERIELQDRNRELTAECERLVEDRSRVSDELDKLLGKLEGLGGKAQ